MSGKVVRRLREVVLESSVFLAPALILAIQMSGKGFSSSFQVGGTIGLALVWTIGLALMFKFCIVDGLARYTLYRGESIFSYLPNLPGPRNWGTWLVLTIYTFELMAYTSIALFAATVLENILPGNEPITVLAVVIVLVVLVMLIGRSFGFLEKMVYFIIAVVFVLMTYTLVAVMVFDPSAPPVIIGLQSELIDDFMLLVGSGSGLSLLLYSEWVSEKIKRVPKDFNRKQVLTGVRTSLVFAFLITGIFSFVIMAVAASGGTGDVSDFFNLKVGYLPLAVPMFILAVGMLMFGIVFVGIDGRARAIGRMLRRMGLTKMEKDPLHRVLCICFVAIVLAALMLGEPKNILLLVSSFSAVLFALTGFSLVYLNTKLEAPYRAGWLWMSITGIGSMVFLIIALIRERTFLEFGVPMLLRLAVVALMLFLLARYGVLRWMVKNATTLKGAALLVAVFGAISVFGTMGSIVYDGVLVNFRDLGAIIGGALGGPFLGTLVGIIGGAYRYSLGGWTALPCFVATISAGLVSGLFSRYWNGKLSYLKLGFLVVLVEGMHLFLYLPLLTMGAPLGLVLDTIANVTVPMMVTNLMGMMIFGYCIHSWRRPVGSDASPENLPALVELGQAKDGAP